MATRSIIASQALPSAFRSAGHRRMARAQGDLNYEAGTPCDLQGCPDLVVDQAPQSAASTMTERFFELRLVHFRAVRDILPTGFGIERCAGLVVMARSAAAMSRFGGRPTV